MLVKGAQVATAKQTKGMFGSFDIMYFTKITY